jgi:hypothetical protein
VSAEGSEITEGSHQTCLHSSVLRQKAAIAAPLQFSVNSTDTLHSRSGTSWIRQLTHRGSSNYDGSAICAESRKLREPTLNV